MSTRNALAHVRTRPWAAAAALLLGLSAGCDVPTALPRFENTLALPAPDLVVPVLGVPASATVTVDMADVDDAFADRVIRGEVQFTPVNPGNVTGTLEITMREPQSNASVTGTVQVTGAAAAQVIEIPQETMRAFLGRTIQITASGALGPVSVPPGSLRLESLVRITFEIGGEG